MKKMTAEGDHLILEKMDYEEEKVSEGGIIYKVKDSIDGSFCEAKIISMGRGLPVSNGNIPEVSYKEGDTILYDARSRIGIHNDCDIIRREHVVAVVNDETD
jgi:co-chaperonin GroES (HSP10)